MLLLCHVCMFNKRNKQDLKFLNKPARRFCRACFLLDHILSLHCPPLAIKSNNHITSSNPKHCSSAIKIR